jgi:surfactin synthase thioesterase subunit
MAGNSDETNLWLRRFHSAPEARTRLICLPHAGGSASFYFSASQFMAPAVEVLAVQYPGRQDRHNEKCIDTIDQLADEVFQVIRHWADRPLALFGHSMGATLAFEVARRLENDGVVPTGLFVSGRRAPCRHRDEKVHLRDDESFVSEVKTLSGTDSRLLDDPEVLDMILPAIRSDFKAAETYRYHPGPKLRSPIFAFIGDSDPKSTVSEARAWSEHTVGRFELQVFTGGHFYINSCMSAILNTILGYIHSTWSPYG